MRSVADSLREDTRRRASELSPEARLEQALALGDADVAALSEARGITAAEARKVIARSRQQGRRRSKTDGN